MVGEIVDCHCHLEDEQFSSDLGQVISRARDKNIIMVTSGLGLDGAYKALNISEEFEGVFCTIGFEPYSERDADEVIDFIRENKQGVVGIGEVGLDFYRAKTDNKRERQRTNFVKFIQLSEELDLPLVVHSRSAGEKAINTLINEKAGKVLMHAFDGRAVYALRGVDAGFLFSIPPSIVRSRQKQKLVKRLPLESLCLESDAPVLGPKRKERNEPSFVIKSAEMIAELKNIELDRVIEQTTRNAKKFYGID